MPQAYGRPAGGLRPIFRSEMEVSTNKHNVLPGPFWAIGRPCSPETAPVPALRPEALGRNQQTKRSGFMNPAALFTNLPEWKERGVYFS
jgi:hypothetical protein